MIAGLRPTGAGLGVAIGGGVLVVVGVVTGWTELTVAGVAALGALVASVAFVLPTVPLTTSRLVQPARVHRLGRAQGVVTVARTGGGGGRWSRWADAWLTLHDRVGDETIAVGVPRSTDEANELVYRLPTRQRGRLVLGPVTISRTDPLGLVVRTVRHGEPESLWVLPRVHPMDAPGAGLLIDLEGPVSDRALEGTVTFAGIRPYALGDDLRLVHWRSTARTGSLMVRQMVDTTHPELAVVLDTRDTTWDDEAFEAGVELAASLVRASHAAGRGAALVIPDDGRDDGRRERDPGTAGTFATTDPLERLALARRGPLDATDLRGAIRRAASAGLLVVVSGAEADALAAEVAGVRQGPTIGFSLGAVDDGAREGAGSTGEPSVTHHGRLLVIAAPDAATAAVAWNRRSRR